MNSDKYVIHSLPVELEVRIVRAIKPRSPKNSPTLFLADNGKVYSTRRGSIYMLSRFDSSAAQRSAFCRLSGVKPKDLEAARQKSISEDCKLDQLRRVRKLRDEAAALGYRLTRIKTS